MNQQAKPYDLVVIGTGSAGSTVAYQCRKVGWSVAIVDSRPFGGTCALRGCDPKKVLVGAADIIDSAERMNALGLITKTRLDWSALIRFKQTFTGPIPANRLAGYHKAGIATYEGSAAFTNESTIQIGHELLTAKHIVIAAGAKPTDLPIDGAHHLTTSDQFLNLKRLPERIVFVGGGFISFEFAHIAARAGADVTILHSSDRPLAGFDQDLVAQLVESTRAAGVNVVLNHPVKAIEKLRRGYQVTAGSDVFLADLVVHGAGRVPDLDELNLSAGKVEREKRGVVVNKFLQSISNPLVYAAGDVSATDGLPLTPLAGYEGSIVAKNLLDGNHVIPDYRVQPSVVFTIPPLATVGLSEDQARAARLKFRVQYEDTTDWYSSRRLNTTKSSYKVIVEETTDQIIGAHLFGPHADEVINLFALAMKFNVPASELKELSYAYPTSGSDVPYMV